MEDKKKSRWWQWWYTQLPPSTQHSFQRQPCWK